MAWLGYTIGEYLSPFQMLTTFLEWPSIGKSTGILIMVRVLLNSTLRTGIGILEIVMNVDRQSIQLAGLVAKSIVIYKMIESRIADSLLAIE